MIKQEEKPNEKSQCRELTLREEVEAVADGGEIAQLVDDLTRTWYSRVLEPGEKQRLIDRAIQHHGDRGPLQLVDGLMGAVIEYDASLLIRAQVYAGEKIATLDGVARGGLPNISGPIADEDLRRIMDQEDHLLSIMERYARVRRVLALADAARESCGIQSRGPVSEKVTFLFPRDRDHA